MKGILVIKRLFMEDGVTDQEPFQEEEIIDTAALLTYVVDGKIVKEAEEGIKMKVVLLKVDSG